MVDFPKGLKLSHSVQAQLCECGCKCTYLWQADADGKVTAVVKLNQESAVMLGHDLVKASDGGAANSSRGVGHA